ncbi:acetylcholinesterase [Mactra antiquata]
MKLCFGLCIYFGILMSITSAQSSTRYVYVNTQFGNVTGIIKPVNFIGQEFYCSQFLGIPYADPPIGNRRFERPRLYSGYHPKYNATYHRPHCMQSQNSYKAMKYFKMNEDCLYLNIYTPGINAASKKVAVMVFIHGGSYSFGGSDLYSGEVISSAYDVVVVTLNYRLNIFGFISDGSTYSGNLGLWDQQLALKWIQNNIKDFGGDPAEVTLFGSSSGASSALLHSIYPRNVGLFRRVISQSGSFLASWALQRNPIQQFSNVLNETGCASGLNAMKCLKRKPMDVLVKLGQKYSFAPVIDGNFILEDPTTLFVHDTSMKKHQLQFFHGLDFLSGVNSMEGASVFDSYSEEFSSLGINVTEGLPRDLFKGVFVPFVLRAMYGPNVSNPLKQSVIHKYSTWPNPDDPINVRNCLVQLASDTSFVVPAIQNAIIHSTLNKTDNKSSTYFYLFDARTSLDQQRKWVNGAAHTMELPFVFGFPDPMKLAIDLPVDSKLHLPVEESFLTHAMMNMWTRFAKTGNPNSAEWQKLTAIPKWETFNPDTQKYLEISLNMTKASSKDHLAAEQMDFWTKVVPDIELYAKCACAEKSQRSNVAGVWSDGYLQLVAWLALMFLMKI